MRTGNVVLWSDRLWIVTEVQSCIVGKEYTRRVGLIAFDGENISAGLTDKPLTGFSVKDAKFLAHDCKSFVMGKFERFMLTGIQRYPAR